MSTPVPQPPPLPIIGNVLNIDPEQSLMSLVSLADKYGPFYKLNFLGKDRYFVGGAELCAELCDETRFVKTIQGPLQYLRPGIGDGVFTAIYGERAWEIAHRILVPAFGPMGIKNMFDEMFDICSQLVAKWARMGPNATINVTDDYTRLTLDSIALCAMDKRFNSFYRSDMHPFVYAMVDFLVEGGTRTRKSRLESFIKREPERKFQADIKIMRDVAQDVINHRRANPSDKKDLLNAMLFGRDPKTGEGLPDESVMNNMLTFLIAGHETTSGMLSFCTYYMLKNPETWKKAQEEVDRVVGKGQVKYEHMAKLPYLEACLKESLRLQPTAPAFSVTVKPGTTDGPIIVGGKYTVPADSVFMFVLPSIQMDSSVYGPDAREFKPERLYAEKFTDLPNGSWKPFGNGARGCIGRPFAMQEALLTLCLIMQNFNLRFEDPSYTMKIKQTMTIKPDKFFMHATLREGVDPIYLEKRMFAGYEMKAPSSKMAKTTSRDGKPMTILYGSNSGTCEGLAQALASNAGSHGYCATVKTLDDATNNFPKNQPVIIISASYEGNAPDNATEFVDWLKKADDKKLKGSKFAVFGCGHKDWAATYQKIPLFLDEEVEAKGGERIVDRGETNVAEGTIFDDFDAWEDKLWPELGSEEESVEEALDMEVTSSARAGHLHHAVQDALVLKNIVLTPPGMQERRHMEFKLPTGMTYQAGDYLALLPINNMPTISRVLKHFGLAWDAMMTLRKGAHTTIPTDKEAPVSAVLGAYVELNNPATKKNLLTLAKYGGTSKRLAELPHHSILEILEACPEIKLPFAVYMSMLNPMRIRQYSISSSPLADPTIASITYSVVEEGGRLGVATNYLRNLEPGMLVQLAVKKSHASFHLPEDDSIPIIMMAAGTGLAPFHGFVQERAAKIEAGKKLGEAALFVGCRHPDEDRMYGEELEEWEKIGAVKLFYAFSRASEKSKGCKYSQDRLWEEREYVSKLFQAGSRGYICGSGRLGKGVSEVVGRIEVEKAEKENKDLTNEEAEKWWEGLRGERYAVDVFD